MGFKIIQVTSIPLQVTKDQMYNMFRCIGEIEDIRLYPTVRTLALSFNSRICFVKFKHYSCGETACYLNNTQMMEHTLQINPYIDDEKEKIPNEDLALEVLAAITNRKNSKSVNKEEEHVKEKADNKIDLLLKENGLPPFPILPNHCSHFNIEQIRRTLVVTNLSISVSGQQVVDHFSKAGEVKYVRFCQRNDDPEFYALVEFTNKEGIIPGLKLNNTEIVDGRQIKVYHSVMAIEKQPEENVNKLVQCEIPASLFEEDYAVILGQALKSESSCQSSAASHYSHSSEVYSSSGDIRSSQNGKSRYRNPSSPSTSRDKSRSMNHQESKSRHCNKSRSRNQNRSKSRKRNRSRSRNRNRPRSRNRQRPRHLYRSNSRNRMQAVQNRRSRSRCR